MKMLLTPPKVGTKATYSVGSDRYACDVIKVSKGGHKIVVQFASATRTDTNGQSESQTWECVPNPKGQTRVAHLCNIGTQHECYIHDGCAYISLGGYGHYQDPHF
jgi:hypothetical protein